MTRGKIALFVLLALAVVCAVLLFARRAREATLRGKTLQQWTTQFQMGPTPLQVDEARNAIRILCSNSLPELVDDLNYDPPEGKKGSWLSLPRLPRWAYRLPLDSIFADKREQRAKTAQLALAALGDEAAPVIDEVWKLTYVNNHQIADRALAVLSRTGTNGMRALIQIVNDPRHPRSSWAVPHFRDTKYLGTNASQAVDLLVRLALSHDVGYDHMATVELGLLGLDPEKAVPALQTVLNTRDNWRRSLAAESLGQFGPNAGPALPDLFKAFADPDPHLNRVVRQAILEIEPNALSAGPPGGRP